MPATGDQRHVVRAWAPGRVNLMGDHTDQTGGRVLPVATDLGTSVRGVPAGERIRLRSSWAGPREVADLALDPAAERPRAPGWVRLVAAVAARVQPSVGFEGTVDTSLPVGAGLSSSASFAVAVALALGFHGSPLELARLGQDAEQEATGVPCGVMDQLAAAAGVAGHALRIDCTTAEVTPVPVPLGLQVLVVHSGRVRRLVDTPYAARVAELQAAEAIVGPLRAARPDDAVAIGDPTLQRRARHVITENRRVDAFSAALRTDDRGAMASLLAASHASLRDDLEVSTPELDALVHALVGTPGVVGARLTGAGFGGCAVALAEAGTRVPDLGPTWRVRPSGGATCAGGGRPSWPGTRRR